MKQFLMASVGFGMLLTAAGAHRAAAATVAYYRFEEGVAGNAATGPLIDSSGNGLSGTPVSSPTYSTNKPTTPFANNLSMSFNGSSWGAIADNAKFELTHSLTVEAFVNPAEVRNQGVGQYILFRGDDRSALDPYTLQVQVRSGVPVFIFAVTNATGGTEFVSAPIPAMNQWYEVAGTLDDATGALKIYVNDVLQATTTTTVRPFGTLDSSQSPGLAIGNLQSGNYGDASKFHGLIDEVRISDQALSSSQLLQTTPEPTVLSLTSICVFGVLRRKR
ncbi:MAG: Immunoglobulin I-set domain protein [Phycisphaerales bacterium]|nr:Immunoglobulin I-set domain protein [Phycisphaerales bacterium]